MFPCPRLLQLDAFQAASATAPLDVPAACPADELIPVEAQDGAQAGNPATMALQCKVRPPAAYPPLLLLSSMLLLPLPCGRCRTLVRSPPSLPSSPPPRTPFPFHTLCKCPLAPALPTARSCPSTAAPC